MKKLQKRKKRKKGRKVKRVSERIKRRKRSKRGNQRKRVLVTLPFWNDDNKKEKGKHQYERMDKYIEKREIKRVNQR